MSLYAQTMRFDLTLEFTRFFNLITDRIEDLRIRPKYLPFYYRSPGKITYDGVIIFVMSISCKSIKLMCSSVSFGSYISSVTYCGCILPFFITMNYLCFCHIFIVLKQALKRKCLLSVA